MIKKFIAFVLIAAFGNVCAASAFDKTAAEKEGQQITKIKAGIQPLGTGGTAHARGLGATNQDEVKFP